VSDTPAPAPSPARPLGYLDYLKEAALRPVKTRVLGAMPLTQMMLVSFGLAGLFNAGFWLLGLAGLVTFVGGRSASARFQKLVAAEQLMAKRALRGSDFEDRARQAIARLKPGAQARYRMLAEQCREILGQAPGEAATGGDLRTGNLNQLLWLFLRLLASREGVQDVLSRVDRDELRAEADDVRGRLTAAEPEGALARSLASTLDILDKRLANVDTAEKNLAVIDAELTRIEQQVRLVREESAVSGRPELLSARLDAVTSTIGETSRWMDQHAELLTSLGSDDFDASAAPLLPAEAGEPARPAPPPPRARERAR
jgi:hypothetical protein